MSTIAVIAHRKKTLGGGLDELRKLISDQGVDDPLWYEVDKSAKAPKKARKALREGAELVFVWGGDGMVQSCADAMAGSGAALAIVAAGTANMLAGNLGIPQDLPAAVRIGFHGRRRRAFDDARLDDGRLEVGVATAKGVLQLARTLGRMTLGRMTLGRMTLGRSDRSPFVRIIRAKVVDVKLRRPLTYELDGGARGGTTRLKARIVPAAITVCVPEGR